MVRCCQWFGLLVAFITGLPVALAQADPNEHIKAAQRELQPRTITLPNTEITVGEALRELQKQSGNIVADRRPVKTENKLKLNVREVTFWPALEAIARATDSGLSFYQADGIIALAAGPYRPVPVHYEGLFRTAVKRTDLTRDEASGSHQCVLRLEITWEPRFQPFYLDIGPASLLFAADETGKALKAEVPGRGQVHIANRNAVEIDIRTQAPARSVPRLESLHGSFKVIGPSKMLAFSFNPLKSLEKNMTWRQEKEGVKVTLSGLTTASNLWTLDLQIENPPWGPRFESYQSWLDNNQVYLEKVDGQKSPVRLAPFGEEQLEDLTATRAALRYHFKAKEGIRLGQPRDWSLSYRTPGRILDIPATFTFKVLTLP